MNLWIVVRHLTRSGKFVGITTALSVICLSIGVASLVLAMAVVSGFEKTIKNSVIDLTGHVLLFKNNAKLENSEKLQKKLKSKFPQILATTPFLHKEAVVAFKGKVQGVVVQAFPAKQVDEVLNLQNRVVEGEYRWQTEEGMPSAMLGTELARWLNVQLGDKINIVLPKPNKRQSHSFTPKLMKFQVEGIIDLGKYEYNERFVLVQDKFLQELVSWPSSSYTALRMRLKNENLASSTAFEVIEFLGDKFWTKDWFQVNRIFFNALEIEKRLLFFVLLIMLVAACFNFASSLFVSVYRKYSDISILKTMGATKWLFIRWFGMQGVVVGMLGCLLGTIIAVIVASFIPFLDFFSIPGEVYQISHLPVDFRWLDMVAVYLSTILLSILSTIIPSIIGAKLNIVEGLRYE